MIGSPLQPGDKLLTVDGTTATKDNVIDLVRGKNAVGTEVHFTLQRAAAGSRGAVEAVTCVRVPLLLVEHTQGLYQLLAQAKENLRDAETIGAIIPQIEDTLRAIEEGQIKLLQRQRKAIGGFEHDLARALDAREGRARNAPAATTKGNADTVRVLQRKLEAAEQGLRAAQHSLDAALNERDGLHAALLASAARQTDAESSLALERARGREIAQQLASLQDQMKQDALRQPPAQAPELVAGQAASADPVRVKCEELIHRIEARVNAEIWAGHLPVIEAQLLTNKTSIGMNLDADCIVTRVLIGGPAFNSGEIEQGDVLLSIDGEVHECACACVCVCVCVCDCVCVCVRACTQCVCVHTHTHTGCSHTRCV